VGERCKLTQWGEGAVDKRFAAWSKVQLWWQQFLLIFLRTNVMFSAQNKLDIVAGPIPHRAAPYEEFFSWDSRHHCPMEVGAYVVN